ncbi:hypothetical protein L3X38_039687 [Prunus dulcis]|uniref:Uncharacterized protein n=1 Tax=Prunus dulcis TaxID=3755 RepID=A0AAD4V7L4_PRUDU|nr:hypothetical protein L3X38_039687 [Prunus dulcis]
MELQKVEYDFKFYKQCVNVLPSHPCSLGSSEVAAEALEVWRWYLATLRSLRHSIESEMQKVIQHDSVAARQEDRKLRNQNFSRLGT